MQRFTGTAGAFTAARTIEHLFDSSRRSSEMEMDSFLTRNYGFVPEMAERLDADPRQLLVDCILADGIEATTLTRHMNGRLEYHLYDDEGRNPLVHNKLPQQTKDRFNLVDRRASNNRDEVIKAVQKDGLTSDELTMRAAWYLCELSTIGEERDDGQPYSVHPLRAAATLYAILQKLELQGVKINKGDAIALLVTTLLHDSVEDWIRENNHYELDPTVRDVSPLVIFRTMQTTGLPGTRPSHVASATRLLSKNKKRTPGQQTDEEYIDELVTSFFGGVAKHFDTHDNYQGGDRRESPDRSQFKTQVEYDEAVSKFERKQEFYARTLFGGRILHANLDPLTGRLRNGRKNALQTEERGRTLGQLIIHELLCMVGREGDQERYPKDKYPYVDFSKAYDLATYDRVAQPLWVNRFMSDFKLPQTTLA